ncbi:MAG: nucleotide exchange factor GrpE [Gammaproteobacteria bacterium]
MIHDPSGDAPGSNPDEPWDERIGPVPAGQEAEAPEPEDRLAALEAGNAEAQDRLLRLAAELENVRRRAAREIETARRFALERFAGELLPVADSLELALASADEAPEPVREGLQITLKLLHDVFARHHIEPLEPVTGEVFDPELHEAMATQPSAELRPDSVLTLVQKGYQLHQRLLRPARVIVSRAPDGDA